MHTLSSVVVVLCALLAAVHAHGAHSEGERPDDWALYHLQEEHHISNFDAGSFFTLHDFNNDGVWTKDEVRRFYGLDDESLKHISPEKKNNAVGEVFSLFDPDSTGVISRVQFLLMSRDGIRLPDFHLGPGHHGDDEYEYEIHHFEKFHGEDTTEADLTHPEDIAHFAKHDRMEDEELRIAQQQQQTIVEANIPAKFRSQK